MEWISQFHEPLIETYVETQISWSVLPSLKLQFCIHHECGEYNPEGDAHAFHGGSQTCAIQNINSRELRFSRRSLADRVHHPAAPLIRRDAKMVHSKITDCTPERGRASPTVTLEPWLLLTLQSRGFVVHSPDLYLCAGSRMISPAPIDVRCRWI